MLRQSFIVLLPLFLLIFSGFVMGRFVKLTEDTLLRILADFFMPMLVFSSLYLSPISPVKMLTLSASVVFVIILTLTAALGYTFLSSADKRTFTLPVIFMNSGFLLLEGGLSTTGIKASVKSPILWAVVVGFVFNLLNIKLPESLINTFSFGGNAAPPWAQLVRERKG